MTIDLAVFLTEHQTAEEALHGTLDASIGRHADAHLLTEWHPYEVSIPHLCLNHPPEAFITAQGMWFQPDPGQEHLAVSHELERQRVYEHLRAEEQRRDPATCHEHCLVRMALWEADTPAPLTPWKLLWRQTLLTHATHKVVYLVASGDEPDLHPPPWRVANEIYRTSEPSSPARRNGSIH